MVSLLVHAVLGILVVWWIVASNPAVFARPQAGPRVSGLELGLYVFGVGSIIAGWYFNVTFVVDYTHSALLSNPFWGDGSWGQYLRLMFANPASSSASVDYSVGNLAILPLITIIDGRRRGIRRPWLFFVASLFTSFAFSWAFYLVAAERQRRHAQSPAAAGAPRGAAATASTVD